MVRAVVIRTIAGYLVGIAIGLMSVTLLFLGMRAVLDVGGACAEGGPYVSAQPCPNGVPVAMVGGMFGLFAAAGLIVWFGSRLGGRFAGIVALGWPALFIALGFNFLDYGLRPPDGEPGPAWGWLIAGIVFWLMGLAPLAFGIAAWRDARTGRADGRSAVPTDAPPADPRLIVGLVVAAGIVGIWLGATIFSAAT